MTPAKEKVLIGRVEKVDLPELGLFGIPAKIDTGAFTSALHCQDVYEAKENGRKVLYFKVLDPSFRAFRNEDIRVTNYNRRKIKNSSGHYETRFVITASIAIDSRNIETDISLTDRSFMKYPILLGRKFLSQGFIIDVNKTNVLARKKEREKEKQRLKAKAKAETEKSEKNEDSNIIA